MPGMTRSRLWRFTLVQLGVADQGDEAAVRVCLVGAEVGRRVSIGQGREEGRGCSEADRPGREIYRVGVLGATGVGLQAAKVAQGGQVAALEIAQ